MNRFLQSTYCVRRNFPVWPARVVLRRPLYKPPTPPTAAPAIHETPICEKASSKRPLCRAAPSGKMNSGWLCGKYTGSKFRYGESGARFCFEWTEIYTNEYITILFRSHFKWQILSTNHTAQTNTHSPTPNTQMSTSRKHKTSLTRNIHARIPIGVWRGIRVRWIRCGGLHGNQPPTYNVNLLLNHTAAMKHLAPDT